MIDDEALRVLSDQMMKIAKHINTKNKTICASGRITGLLGSNKYKVSINGKDYTVRSHWTHAVNDIVVVIVCNGDWGRLYVLY